MSDRDLKGRFIHGHSPIADRDLSTGRFISKNKTVETDEYIKTRLEVDRFLKEKQLCR